MKRIVMIAAIAVAAMTVYSCKNNGKNEENTEAGKAAIENTQAAKPCEGCKAHEDGTTCTAAPEDKCDACKAEEAAKAAASEAQAEAEKPLTKAEKRALKKAEKELLKAQKAAAQLKNDAEELTKAAKEAVEETISSLKANTEVDVAPLFNGGAAQGFQNWVSSNITYPQDAIEAGQEGVVLVNFIVDKLGNVGNVEVAKGVCKSLDEAAAAAVAASPAWTPATKGGEAVEASYTIPVNFKLQ